MMHPFIIVFIVMMMCVVGTPSWSQNAAKKKENSRAEAKEEGINTLFNNDRSKIYPSIMYRPQDVKWINDALKSYESKIPLEILFPDLFPNESSEKRSVDSARGLQSSGSLSSPESDVSSMGSGLVSAEAASLEDNYYLKSILYFSPDHWIIWVNDEKITPDSHHNIFEVASVTKDRVVLMWRESLINELSPGWEQSMTILSGSALVSNNKNIVIDRTSMDMSFILYPHQRFVVKSVEIVEGKVTASVPSVSSNPMQALSLDSISDTQVGDTQVDDTGNSVLTDVNNAAKPEQVLEIYKEQLIMLQGIMSHMN